MLGLSSMLVFDAFANDAPEGSFGLKSGASFRSKTTNWKMCHRPNHSPYYACALEPPEAEPAKLLEAMKTGSSRVKQE